MRFEHKHQHVISVHQFLIRQLKYLLFAVLLIVFSMGIGVLGYGYFGNLNFIDSFYMASMILTGMGPVVEMKTYDAKLFSSFYALYSGVAFLTITAVTIAPLVHRLLHILQVEKGKKWDNE
jgi:hypothetical protein